MAGRSGSCPIRRRRSPSYKYGMTTTATTHPATATRRFADVLAAHDFEDLGRVLADDVHLEALLPKGFHEWRGADEVSAAFGRWFGDADEIEAVGMDLDVVGGRPTLSWRFRMRAERIGEGWHVVEQRAVLDATDDGRISHIALVCTGYRPEVS